MHTLFNKAYDFIIYIVTYIITFQLLAFIKRSSAAHKQIHHSITLFRISTNHLIGNLGCKIPMVNIGVLAAFGPWPHQPKTVYIDIKFTPMIMVKFHSCLLSLEATQMI